MVFWLFASNPLHLLTLAFRSSTVYFHLIFPFLSYCIAWNHLRFRLLYLGPHSMHPYSLFCFKNCKRAPDLGLFAFGPLWALNICVSFLQESPPVLFYCTEVLPLCFTFMWFSLGLAFKPRACLGCTQVFKHHCDCTCLFSSWICYLVPIFLEFAHRSLGPPFLVF